MSGLVGVRATLAAAGFVLAGVPVQAQDTLLCGGVAGTVSWLGGTEEASDLSSFVSPADEPFLIAPSGSAVVAFTLSEATALRIEAAADADGDPVLDLLTSEGTVVTSDDDGGGGRDSRIETELPPGIYCASVQGYTADAFSGTLRFGLLEHATLTPGSGAAAVCTAETLAEPLADAPLGAALSAGPIQVTGSAVDAPYYRFTLDAPLALSLTATNEAADPVLTIYDATGGIVAENDDAGGTVNARIDQIAPLSPGTYCIGVEALADSLEPITVTASVFSEEEYLASLYDGGSTVPPLDGSYPVEDLGPVASSIQTTVRHGDAVAWLSFSVAEESMLVIEGIGLSDGDPFLALFDEVGRELGTDDDGGQNFDAFLARKLTRGTYLLAVGRAQAGTSELTRVVLDRYVRAE